LNGRKSSISIKDIIIVLISITITTIFAVISSFAIWQMEQRSFANQINSLHEKLEILQSQINSLQNENLYLQDKLTLLQADYDDLRIENNALRAEIVRLQSIINSNVNNGVIPSFSTNNNTDAHTPIEDNLPLSESVSRESEEIPLIFVQEVAPFDLSNVNRVLMPHHVLHGGEIFENAITYNANNISSVHSLHNLGGRFITLSGLLGRVDGAPQRNGTFNFYGNGRQIGSIDVDALRLPMPFTINVTGVDDLKIEFRGHSTYSLIGFIE